MKYKKHDELCTRMWCRKSNGEIYERVSAPAINAYADAYEQGLIDMGAEWFPVVPPNYRIATEEDRRGVKPIGYRFANRWDSYWLEGREVGSSVWAEDCEYLIPVELKAVFVTDGSQFLKQYLPSPHYDAIVGGRWGRVRVTIEPAEGC